jgi:hypothetical protein
VRAHPTAYYRKKEAIRGEILWRLIVQFILSLTARMEARFAIPRAEITKEVSLIQFHKRGKLFVELSADFTNDLAVCETEITEFHKSTKIKVRSGVK